MIMTIDSVVPDLFHIGYQRTGSTWLQKGLFPLLQDYIYVPNSRVGLYYHAEQYKDLCAVYDDISSDCIRGKIIIESEEIFSGGPYFDAIDMAKKISWVNPKAKILICVRSQYTIIASLYYLYVRKGGTLSFNKYVKLLIDNRKLDYWHLIQEYQKVFPKENVMVLFFEDLLNTPEKYVENIMKWIGVDFIPTLPGKRFKNSKKSTRFIKIQRWANCLLGTKAFEREISVDEEKKLRKKIELRSRLLLPFDMFLQKLSLLGFIQSEFSIRESELKRMEETYGPGNKRLFEELGLTFRSSGYPGSRT